MSPNLILLLKAYNRRPCRPVIYGKNAAPMTIVRSTQRFGGRPAVFLYANSFLNDAYGFAWA